ncbi:hypothetical protein CYANOKiyG1_07560 [Okeania sp. KiyG1]|nr:hypothetical protein CYANOKiyG1_07560 [Okeania sp. KiyG1]
MPNHNAILPINPMAKVTAFFTDSNDASVISVILPLYAAITVAETIINSQILLIGDTCDLFI